MNDETENKTVYILVEGGIVDRVFIPKDSGTKIIVVDCDTQDEDAELEMKESLKEINTLVEANVLEEK